MNIVILKKLGNIILKGTNLVICLTHSLYVYELHKFVGFIIRINVLQYTRFYVEIVEIKILVGQRL